MKRLFDLTIGEIGVLAVGWVAIAIIIITLSPTSTEGQIVRPQECESLIIEDLVATDDNYPMGMKNYTRELTFVGVHCDVNCGTPATITFQDRAGNAIGTGAITVSTAAGDTTYAAVTGADADRLIGQGEGVEFNTGATLTANGIYTISVCWEKL